MRRRRCSYSRAKTGLEVTTGLESLFVFTSWVKGTGILVIWMSLDVRELRLAGECKDVVGRGLRVRADIPSVINHNLAPSWRVWRVHHFVTADTINSTKQIEASSAPTTCKED